MREHKQTNIHTYIHAYTHTYILAEPETLGPLRVLVVCDLKVPKRSSDLGLWEAETLGPRSDLVLWERDSAERSQCVRFCPRPPNN